MKQKIITFGLVMLAFITGIVFFSFQQYDFSTLDRDKVKLSAYDGEFVVINYFAEWCAPCLKEVPELNKFNQEKSENTHLFAISYDDVGEQALIELRQKYDMQFDLITHVKTSLPFAKPAYLPATYIIKPDGTVHGPLLGEVTYESLKGVITGLNKGLNKGLNTGA